AAHAPNRYQAGPGQRGKSRTLAQNAGSGNGLRNRARTRRSPHRRTRPPVPRPPRCGYLALAWSRAGGRTIGTPAGHGRSAHPAARLKSRAATVSVIGEPPCRDAVVYATAARPVQRGQVGVLILPGPAILIC